MTNDYKTFTYWSMEFSRISDYIGVNWTSQELE